MRSGIWGAFWSAELKSVHVEKLIDWVKQEAADALQGKGCHWALIAFGDESYARNQAEKWMDWRDERDCS